jgi:Ni/Fe-hydrogenase subunit HybB-like protein
VIFAYLALRTWDVVHRGQLEAVLRMDGYSILFLAEMGLFLVAALGLLLRRRSAGARWLSLMALAVVLTGALYRFSTYLFAFDPGEEWTYFPALPEFAVTIGLVAAEILGYVILVKRFPILRGVPADPRPPTCRPSSETADLRQEPIHVPAHA